MAPRVACRGLPANHPKPGRGQDGRQGGVFPPGFGGSPAHTLVSGCSLQNGDNPLLWFRCSSAALGNQQAARGWEVATARGKPERAAAAPRVSSPPRHVPHPSPSLPTIMLRGPFPRSGTQAWGSPAPSTTERCYDWLKPSRARPLSFAGDWLRGRHVTRF